METEQARVLVEQAWRQHHSTIQDHLYRMCRNHHLSEDLASESFVRLLRSLAKPDATPPRSVVALLRTTARNLLLDYYRSGVTRYEYARETPGRADQAAPSEHVDLETWEAVKSLLSTLPEHQRLVVILRGLRDLSATETAALMGLSPQTVRSLRHFAYQRLGEQRVAAGPDGPFWSDALLGTEAGTEARHGPRARKRNARVQDPRPATLPGMHPTSPTREEAS